MAALTGGAFVPNHTVVADDMEVASATRRIRAQLQAAAAKAGLGVRDLAKRLKVSPSAVSRHLRSEGDIRVSTAVLLAGAMGMKWEMTLVAKPHSMVLDAVKVIPMAVQRCELVAESSMTIFPIFRRVESEDSDVIAVTEVRQCL
ncbi:MAG: hypothetical protein BGO92_05240 [Magnetospirillum sp. 64-120]|nr:MAG: hypothetical protein BGO92_05240 [Magnetospirillum sp. 64-120]